MGWEDKPGGKGKNPWGNGGGDGPRNPWGGGPSRGGGQQPPDLDELLRRAQENFRQVMPGGAGGGKIIAAAMAAILVLWLASGFYFIQPNQNGVVLTFGKYTRTDEMPGLKYRFPWPVQTVDIVDVTQERRIEIGFRDPTGGRAYDSSAVQDRLDESLMLTGDENIIDIDFVVLWRIGNARHYLYEIRDPEDTVKKVAESAMREAIGRTQIQPALTEARGQIQSDTRALMQKMLDEYQSGITINNVQLQKVDPPAPVIDAFNEVQRARADRERLRNEAEAYRNDIIPKARGEAERLRQQAEAYKGQVVNRSEGDAERFKAVYGEYKNARDVTAERLYLETLETVLGNARTIVMQQGGNNAGVVPYLPLNELPALRKIEPAAGGQNPSSMPPQPGSR